MSEETKVVDNTEEHRYELLLDGQRVGVERYLDLDGQRVFYATEVDPAFGGRGLASVLIHDALTDAVGQGKRVVPVCPFVVRYVGKHHDFDDHLDPATDAVREAVSKVFPQPPAN